MPGGLAGVKAVTQELKAAGVRVLWPYNPWDRGTRREMPDSDAHTLAMLLQRTGGDGFNGDTMFTIPETFWTAAAVDRQYPIALEPEDGGIDDGLNWHTLGWGYWDFQADVPIVDRFKFLTRGKFLTHACDRWAKNKTNNLHAAFFNGAGYEAWENVWGVWNGIVPRDGEAIRRMAAMLRFLGSSAAGYVLRSPFWVPHTPEVAQRGVFASKWPAHQSLPPFPAPFAARIADLRSNATSHVAMRDEAQAGGNALLNAWTLVNRAGRDFDGSTVQLRVHAASETSRFFDCYAGREIAPLAHDDARLQKDEVAPNATTTRTLHFALEREGFGCVLELGGAPNSDVAAFLSSMAKLTRTPLSALPNAWTYLPQVLVPNGRTPHTATPPPGGPYVFIPYAPAFLFKVKSLQVEGDDAHGVDVQYPWEAHPRREHEHTLSIAPFWMDRFPVTNRRYSEYLKATGYRPRDRNGWLRSWNGSKTPPPAIAERPVTYVSLREARLFCSWAGGRLPHSYEWQYAAQGLDGRLYPWGTTKNASNELPTFHEGTLAPGPEPVGAHSPQGDSPFGVADMVGNVWQYTDEFYDDHTRAVILRGGSNYRPAGSQWYFPNAPELNVHNKYFLFDDAYERAATVSFRCVVDAAYNQQLDDGA